MEEDLKWIVHTKCKTHGSSCGGSLSQKITSGIFTINEKKVEKFAENYFSYLDEEPREILKSSLISLFDTEGYSWTHKYIDISCEESDVNKSITGDFFFMYAEEGSGEKHKVFIGLAQLTKRPATNYYFLKDYYKGNEDRVKQALKHMLYKDVKSKGLITN